MHLRASRWLLACPLLLAGLFLSVSARADVEPECRLKQYASLDIRTDNKDRILIPVTVEGHKETFIVDTGMPISMLTRKAAAELGLEQQTTNHGRPVKMVSGLKTDETVTVPRLKIGDIEAEGVHFAVYPKDLDASAAGLLGADIIGNYDIDLDFAANKMNLFSSDHCPGQVIYWTQAPYASVPFRVNETHHIEIPIKLDYVPMIAEVDTGAPTGVAMSVATARDLFGWRMNSNALKRVRGGRARYSYPFGLLTLAGVSVKNPSATLDEKFETATNGSLFYDDPDVLVGLAALRPFHVYISYKDQLIYLTAANAH